MLTVELALFVTMSFILCRQTLYIVIFLHNTLNFELWFHFPILAEYLTSITLRTVLFHINTPGLGCYSRTTPYSNLHIFLFTPVIEVIFSILLLRCHKLHDALELIFVTPSLYGYEAFLMFRALTDTKFT